MYEFFMVDRSSIVILNSIRDDLHRYLDDLRLYLLRKI